MSLSDATKTDIRRHLDFPAFGLPSNSSGLGFRINELHELLEQRMLALSPSEEAKLTGFAYGAVANAGADPLVGDTASVTVAGGGLGAPVTVTATASAGDTRVTLMAKLATAINQNSALRAVNIIANAPWGTGPWSGNDVVYPQCALIGPVAFTLTAASTGQTGVAVTEVGGKTDPVIRPDRSTVIYGLVPICNYLESIIGSASDNLGTARADVWVGRANEVQKRNELYKLYVNRLSAFLGIQRKPRAGGGGRMVI